MMTQFCAVALDETGAVVTIGDVVSEIPESVPEDTEYWPVVWSAPSYDPAIQRQSSTYTVSADADSRVCTALYDIAALPLAELRQSKVAAINAERDRLLAQGAPYGAKRIDVSDKGRADLGGMAIAALLAQSGAVPWSDSYSTGWITQDNIRLPLPGPGDGLALAAAVGDWYGAMMQHARNLKDQALASDDPAVVDGMAGWPD